uniref:ATP synthase F0 subunit 8 n=1 Tax=Teredorus hainanensis TaxID=2936564 RepID=A0A8T9VVN7_9ORTH|nr:ATP synthase F0 subunit 8 [Teredorus hainanensis]UPH84294.1 ATP synthase F0 subunit 8 [Teredorus hainanensis]
MPQMSNLWWLPIMVWTSIMLFMMKIIIFNTNTQMHKTLTKNKNNITLKKWQW